METIISKHQKTITLNAKNEKKNDSKILTEKLALSAYESDSSNAYGNGGFERLCKWWL